MRTAKQLFDDMTKGWDERGWYKGSYFEGEWGERGGGCAIGILAIRACPDNPYSAVDPVRREFEDLGIAPSTILLANDDAFDRAGAEIAIKKVLGL